MVRFGGTGDLASRELFPALADLRGRGRLPADFGVVATGTGERSTEDFTADLPEDVRDLVEYRQADATVRADVKRAVAGTGPVVVYLSLPPSTFLDTVGHLAAIGLPPGSRLVLEKPFAEGLAPARELNALLAEHWNEDDVFRVDHFLGKQTVQNLLGLRFANRIFEPLWSNQHIDRVELTFDETLGFEGRAGYYDSAGALVDMVQNHLLQVLCLVAMEPPVTLGADDFRRAKLDVLRSVRSLTPAEVGEHTVRARYDAGTVDGKDVPAYVDEDGVDPDRGTETFAQVTLAIDSWRWAGVPFVLRTGKALETGVRRVTVHFKPVPHLAFDDDAPPAPNRLMLEMDPDRLVLDLAVNRGEDVDSGLTPLRLEGALAGSELSAYARVLLDILEGDRTLSIGPQEAEEAWRIVEPIRTAWAAGTPPLGSYPAGSSGPGD